MTQQSQQHTPPNRLAQETSPYLQQHAHNPVDWYPWGDEALAKARAENKPILLSIGYSACHWCHVMAHESFEDPDTAALMNELFVNIKVDREERPDLDKIYQFAHQLLAQRGGGWPLTMFLMPEDQTPFFGGTYFPKQPRYGMPAFENLMRQVEKFYREHPDDLGKQNASVRDYLLRASEGVASPAQQLDATPLDDARRQLAKSFDGVNGGFGGAPKFPHASNLERLLRHWRATVGQDEDALLMTRNTLHAMAAGGIYDQLGGGFCRYSVDTEWEIPHFEKMLYDNGPLLAIYADAWAATGDVTFQHICEETGDWVMREMQALEGGYYSTLDADSEGEEGKFYAWTQDEIRQCLDEKELAVARPYFGLDQTPNFEGKWHLKAAKATSSIAAELGISETEALDRLSRAKVKLFAAREQRVHPGRDEKILTSWNGLMIKGMAVAGRRLGRADFIASAQQALDFVRNTLWQEGRLLATYKDGKAHLAAYLDDYVFLADGILALLEVRWREEDMSLLQALMETVLTHFSAEDGGFYFTADDHEQLIQRPRPWADEATPAGNGVAAHVLLRLGHLLGETRYLDAAEHCLQRAWAEINHMPHAHNTLLHALEEFLYPTEVVVLRGDGEIMQEWLAALARDYAPRRLLLPLANDSVGLPEKLASYAEPDSGVLAYVCRAGQCLAPLSALGALQDVLAGQA